ncbi:protein MLN51 homolog isoform X1 [Typha latifolia]|uniref:protein MLN51 homolog isoform X1 n=1 Tax=Typha latifolia TaxID=4733 RepID=UPI003C2FE072
MAGTGEEMEYESDPEDVPLPSMRRREASDDEDGEGSDGRKTAGKDVMHPIGSDAESDGQGGAQVYDEEDAEYEEEEVDEELEEEEELEYDEGVSADRGMHVAASKVDSTMEGGKESVGASFSGEALGEPGKDQPGEEEKKENEPYAVPTSGAFYMHDDRFQENGRGRHRRTFGGQKLWDTKDERAWVHDRFEEMNLQDKHYDEERRRSKGRFRGRGGGKTRGTDHGYFRGNRSHTHYDDGNNQNQAPRTVRGRGPRRYEPLAKSNRESQAMKHRQFAKSQEVTSNATVVRQSIRTSNALPEPVVQKKHVFASSLNSASPPFYPSGSSNQENSVGQRRDAQIGRGSKGPSSLHMENNSPMPQSGPMLRAKTVVESVVHDRSYDDSSLRSFSVKTTTSSPVHSSGFTLSPTNADQSSNSNVQGRGSNFGGSPNSQSTLLHHQVARVSATQAPQSQMMVVQQKVFQTPNRPAVLPTQQLSHGSVSGSKPMPPPQPSSANLTEDGGNDSPPGNKSKIPLVGKGKLNNQVTGSGSFLYSGAQVIGASGVMGLAHGDQGFPGTPALLPVMQFAGQHHGGLGVPAVGMALPGYVAQSQLGFGNSDMGWVPVLAGAAGGLGASYCPPYIALDSNYYTRPSGHTSSSASSRESGTIKTAKSPPRPAELVNEEFGQRQNKPRRYSEMNFGQ